MERFVAATTEPRSDAPDRAAGPRHWDAAYALTLTALTAAFFWPVVHHPFSRVIYGGGDGANVMWAWWHVGRDLAQLHNPVVTRDIFFPIGTNLGFHTISPLVIVLMLPIIRVGGPAFAVNVVQVASALAAGLAMYLLLRRLVGTRSAAMAGAVIFEFCPYRFVHAPNHYTLIHSELLPISVLALLRLADKPSRHRAAIVGVILGAAYLTDEYLFVFVSFTIGILVVSNLEGIRDKLPPRLIGLVVLSGALVALPLVVVQIAALQAHELSRLPRWGGADAYSADLLSWFLPPPGQPIWGQYVGQVLGGYGEPYVGVSVIAVAYAAKDVVARARRRPWVLLVAASSLLALGPFLHLGGRSGSLLSLRGTHFTIPLPYMAWAYLPLVNGIRAPVRFVIVAEFGLAVLAALTLATCVQRSRRGNATTFLFVLIVLVEFLPGALPTISTQAPTPYFALGHRRDGLALLELPLQWSTGSNVIGDLQQDETIFLYWATFHGHPMVGGSVARLPNSRLHRLEHISLYRQVAALDGDARFDDRPTFSAADLLNLRIGYVAYHEDRPRPAAREYISSLHLPVLAQDATMTIWRVPTPDNP